MNNDYNCQKRIVCKSYINDLDDAIIMVNSLIKNRLNEEHKITFIVPSKDTKSFKEKMPGYIDIIQEESLYDKNETDWFSQRNNKELGWITQQVSKLKYGALMNNEVLYYVDSDAIIFRKNFRNIIDEELKIFTIDKQCTVGEDGRICLRKKHEKDNFIYKIKENVWQEISRQIFMIQKNRTRRISWKTKHELIEMFLINYKYFNPMPLPIISGKHIKKLEENALSHGLSLIDLIEYSPHEYYWIFLNAASQDYRFNFDEPHAIHVKNRETLVQLWKKLLRGERIIETVHALVLAPKKMRLELSVRKELSKYLQELN